MREGPQVLPCLSPGEAAPPARPRQHLLCRPLGASWAGVCTRVCPASSNGLLGDRAGAPSCQKACARTASPATHTSQARRPAREPGVSSQGSGPQSTVAWGERPAPTPAWRRHGGHGVRPPAPPGGLPCLSRALILARGRFGPTPSDSTYSHRGGEGSPPQLPPLTHHCPMTPVKPLASAPSPRLQVGL